MIVLSQGTLLTLKLCHHTSANSMLSNMPENDKMLLNMS